MEFLKPILTIRQKEMDYIILAIVEAERVPSGMLVAIARIEELVRISC
jgi:hypothetical protein